MKKIDHIIRVLQDGLEKENKSYYTLSQCTKILKEKGILSQSDISDGYLKSLLQTGMIPQASQTSKKPKQWRILREQKSNLIMKHPKKNVDVSLHKLTENKNINDVKLKSLINTERTHREDEDPLYFLCPICGVNLSVPKKYRKYDELKCYNCHRTFKNPIFYPNDKTVYKKNLQQNSNHSFNQSKKHLPIGTQIFRGLLAGLIVWVFIRGCTKTPEESMRQYQKEQKSIREYEKQKKETDEYFEFMGGQE